MPLEDATPPKVLGVLAGRDLAPGALQAWLAWADRVVAADGGADLCRAAGHEPDAIVGDLDSIGDASGLTRDEDQDTSDADKLLAYFAREGINDVILIGVEGDRLDHVLATLYLLRAFGDAPDRNRPAPWYLRRGQRWTQSVGNGKGPGVASPLGKVPRRPLWRALAFARRDP